MSSRGMVGSAFIQKTASGHPRGPEFVKALRCLYEQDGCECIATGRPFDEKQPGRLWIAIGMYLCAPFPSALVVFIYVRRCKGTVLPQAFFLLKYFVAWKNAALRTGQRQSEAFSALREKAKHLIPDSDDEKNDLRSTRVKSLDSVHMIGNGLGSRPEEVYEIFTAYFPADISAHDKARVTGVGGFPQIINNMNNVWPERGERSDPMGPMDDLKWQLHGWVEGEVEYNGQRCIRLVNVALWMYPYSSEIYKESQWWFFKRSHRDGRELKLAIEVLLDDMEECGMVGHSSVIGRFENLFANTPLTRRT